MSDSKRTGSRDISDLKARLGLKKGGAGPTTGQTSSTRPSNGVVAPPGLNLPPPPGMQQPASQQPAAPAIPNAADDPFGAMNAMAAVGTVQRAPEIVIVNDGNPVEHVGQKSTGATIAKIAIPAALALVIGLALGKIGSNANRHNEGIEGAKEMLGDKGKPWSIVGVKKTLSSIDTLLDEERTKNGFRPDHDFDQKLSALAGKLKFDAKEQTLLSFARGLPPDVAGSTIKFYAGVAEVKALIDTHEKAATALNNVYAKSKEKMDAAALKESENAPLQGQLRYAILIQAPTDADTNVPFGAKLVELGGLFCGSGKTPVAHCSEGESPSGVAYRTDIGAPILNKGDIASPGNDSVPTKKIVPLLDNTIRDSLIKGAGGMASEAYYQRRLRTLYELLRGKTEKGKSTKGLIEEGNDLQRRMSTEANKSTKFTWFM